MCFKNHVRLCAILQSVVTDLILHSDDRPLCSRNIFELFVNISFIVFVFVSDSALFVRLSFLKFLFRRASKILALTYNEWLLFKSKYKQNNKLYKLLL